MNQDLMQIKMNSKDTVIPINETSIEGYSPINYGLAQEEFLVFFDIQDVSTSIPMDPYQKELNILSNELI